MVLFCTRSSTFYGCVTFSIYFSLVASVKMGIIKHLVYEDGELVGTSACKDSSRLRTPLCVLGRKAYFTLLVYRPTYFYD